MPTFNRIPHPITILMLVILLGALATWLVPAGKYHTIGYDPAGKLLLLHQPSKTIALPYTQQTLDSLGVNVKLESFANGDIRKPISVPNTYERLPKNEQGLADVVKAPLQGLYDTMEIMVFLFLIGGFINVFYSTGAMEKGLLSLSKKMKGREGWLIIMLTFLFSFGGASFGMAEECLAFYPILVPLFLAAGYDLLVPVAVIFGGAQLGFSSSFSNPFSTIIASNAAGVNWTDGMNGRLLYFALVTLLYIWYVSRYASKVKRNPQASLVVLQNDNLPPAYAAIAGAPGNSGKLHPRDMLLLFLFLATFLVMIAGVIFLEWWLLEMTAVFLVSAVAVAVLVRMQEHEFIQKFIKGAGDMVGVTLIIGAARGVSLVLENGNISDSIIFYASQIIVHMSPAVFILVLLVLFMLFTVFIPSSSGMAVVTMPIIGSLAFVAGVPGREIVNAYLFGMGIMGFLIPTGLILPTLMLVNISFKSWWKFIWPFLLLLFTICCLFLIIGINL